MKKMTKAELEMKCRFLEERLEKIPKRELEIRCKVLEERMKRIYELCEKYTGISNAAETIGEDPKQSNLLANVIKCV